MLQQVIVAVIGVAVAIYVVYRIMRIIRGKSSRVQVLLVLLR